MDKSIEYWDVYDINRNKTGKIIKNIEKLLSNEYHLFVQVWIMNDKGLFLSQQRAKNMKWPLMWCANGGNAKAGEDSYTCAKREIKEELDLDLDTLEGKLFDSRIYKEDGQNYFCDSYIYICNKSESEYNFQKEEIEKLEYMSIDKIIDLMEKGKYFVYDEDYLKILHNYSMQRK